MSKYKPKPRDQFGARQGTIAAKVNRAMSNKGWMSVDEIAKAARISRESVHRRLQNGRRIDVYDYQRTIKFKLKTPSQS